MYASRSAMNVFGIHKDENSMHNNVKKAGVNGGRGRAVLGDLGNQNRAIIGGKRKETKPKSTRPSTRTKSMRLNEEPEPMELDEEAQAIKVLPAGVTDIDTPDASDPQLVTEYVDEIDVYMKQLERKFKVQDNYLRLAQTDISENMRSILLDWLVEVHLRFKLAQETMFLTAHIIDRFLSVHKITRDRLQLVGITAMLVASKYEDMYPPEVRDFVWISDGAYENREIIKMEGLILKMLDYNLGTPLPLQFYRRLSKATNANAETHHLGKYLMELSICNYNMCGYEASKIATAAMYLAIKIMTPSEDAWTPNLEYYSGYTKDEVEVCINKMGAALCSVQNSKQQAIRRKFSGSRLLKVSELPEVKAYMGAL